MYLGGGVENTFEGHMKHLSKGDVLEAILMSLESIVFKLVPHYC